MTVSSSDSKIKILPENLINKISAGEVVERPASVVKELMENAIDSGATEVQVGVKNGGKDLISILDNGCGMNESDAHLAVARHATSKIYNEDDLFRISTLGFRGEALASIASVSHFELLTCNDEKRGGTRIFIKGGYVNQQSRIGFPKGTKVTVERLFFNTPARLKFLKTTATELQHIQMHILQKSLANPNIHFRLTHNQKLLLNLPRGDDLQIRIQQIFGEEFLDTIFPVNHEETSMNFSGFISFPSKPRKSRRWQYIFVNDRNVKSPTVTRGIYDGYGIFMGKTQHPAFFLSIKLDPTEIDVNVHPAKTEIRFRNSQLIHTILEDQISTALKECASRRFFGRKHSQSHKSYTGISGQIEMPIEDQLPLEGKKSSYPTTSKKLRSKSEYRDLKPIDALRYKESSAEFFQNRAHDSSTLSDIKTKTQISSTTALSTHASSIKKNFVLESKIQNLLMIYPLPNKSKNIRVLGQFRETFIIFENDNGLVLIDQCALHQRLIYEVLFEAIRKKKVPVKTSKASLLLELTPKESVMLEKIFELLSICGFALSPFGGNTFAVNSIPKFLFEDQVNKVIRKILDRSTLFKKSSEAEETLSYIALKVAEISSIKPVQILEMEEMECLLAQWESLGSPFYSMQDTPLLIEISLQEIKKKLRMLL
ncbi:MAG: DNA mismatch repair protein [Deltaproteobacteria bacterium]|nr:DNA mismatch repair protein [Deltaproteobacteria bacterium]